MRETWYYIVAEFRALGWRCVAYGPEFWLVVPLTVAMATVGKTAYLLVHESFVRTTQKNPFVTKYQWEASNSERMCPVCERGGSTCKRK